MQYTHQNVTLDISVENGDFPGDCRVNIPFSHKKFFKEVCGFEKNHRFTSNNWEHIFEHEYGEVYIEDDHYRSSNPDIIIMYLAWLLEEDEEFTVDVTYNHPFWAIHDIQHALYDSAGCTIYVNPEIERERLVAAFDLMKEKGYIIEYDIVEEVQEAYNSRFDKNISFEEYLYDEEFEEDEEEELV